MILTSQSLREKRGTVTTRRAPESYLNHRRPPLLEAIVAEGDMSIGEAVESLKKKGYYTPHPRPWQLGYKDRGLGRGDYAVLDRFGDLVAEFESKADAELVISVVNAQK